MGRVITLYAEKYDIGLKLAATLSGGLNCNGTNVTMANVENVKDKLGTYKHQGYIPFEYNGNHFYSTWGSGHMGELYQAHDYDPRYAKWSEIPEPFIPSEYKVKIREGRTKEGKLSCKPDPNVVRQLNIVKGLFNKSDTIYLCTDDDREGQLIGYYVFLLTGVDESRRRIGRILLSEMTEAGIRKAFKNAVNNKSRKGIEDAGRARAIADWVVGINMTLAATMKYRDWTPSLRMWTEGRVQTPVLDLVVARHNAVKSFVSKPIWHIEGKFTNNRGETYIAKHSVKQYENKEDALQIMSLLKGAGGMVVDRISKPVKKEVPLLYNITELQKDANTAFGYSPKFTTDTVEWLYQHGLTSYPRPESQVMPDDMMGEPADQIIDMLATLNEDYKRWIEAIPKEERNYTKRHFDTSKVSSHYAIVPTNVSPAGVEMTEAQKNIYDLIAKSMIRIIYHAAEGEKTTLVTEVYGEKFICSGTVMQNPQWLQVNPLEKTKDVILPDVKKGEVVSAEFKLQEGKTTPPSEYTEATLLTAMQTASKSIDDEELKEILKTKNKGGIGRPSTQGPIVESVVKRYCTKKGKYIIPTDDACKMIAMFPVDDLKSPEMTAQWELQLDNVEKGTLSMEEFVSNIEKAVRNWTAQIIEDKPTEPKPEPTARYDTGMKCPHCGKPILSGKYGWYCSGRADGCKFSVGLRVAGKKTTETMLKDLVEKKKTAQMKGFKTKEGKEFSAALCVKEDGSVGFQFANKGKRKADGESFNPGSGSFHIEL